MPPRSMAGSLDTPGAGTSTAIVDSQGTTASTAAVTSTEGGAAGHSSAGRSTPRRTTRTRTRTGTARATTRTTRRCRAVRRHGSRCPGSQGSERLLQWWRPHAAPQTVESVTRLGVSPLLRRGRLLSLETQEPLVLLLGAHVHALAPGGVGVRVLRFAVLRSGEQCSRGKCLQLRDRLRRVGRSHLKTCIGEHSLRPPRLCRLDGCASRYAERDHESNDPSSHGSPPSSNRQRRSASDRPTSSVPKAIAYTPINQASAADRGPGASIASEPTTMAVTPRRATTHQLCANASSARARAGS